MIRRTTVALGTAVAALTLVALPALSTPVRAEEPATTTDKLVEFCGEFESMEVTFVVDQSGSLRDTDPDQRRLEAGTRFIRNLNGLPIDVAINVSGFGDTFSEGDWVSLDSDGGVDQAVGALQSIVRAPLQNHTDYVLAMQGALDTYEGRSADETCRTFVWFTDGHHDLTPPDGKPRPYENNLSDYATIVGPARAPLLSAPIETPQDAAVVGGLLDPLTCDPHGFGDQLVDGRIFTRVLLLDTTGAVAANPSWQTIERMLEGGDACGTHGVVDPGESISAGSIDEIIWNLSCPTGLPNTVSGTFEADAFPLTLQGIAPDVPIGLITSVSISAFGDDGLVLTSSTGTTGESSGNLALLTEEFNADSPPSSTWSFNDESGNVERACTAVTISEPIAIAVGDPKLRDGEPGGYDIEVSGPFGPLSERDIERLDVGARPGKPSGSMRWELDSVPPELLVEITIEVPGLEQPTMAEQKLNVLPRIGFPFIELEEAALVGDGSGPFEMPIHLDPGDGGTLCLESTEISVLDEHGETIPGTVRFSSGEPCVTDFENPPEALIVEFDQSAFVHDSQFGLEFTSHNDGEDASQAFDVPTTLRPVANRTIEALIIAAVMALILLMFWAVLYIVNRRSVRIPNLHNHRWYRFDATSPETLAKASEKVDVNATKRPTRSNGEFNAGQLRGKRHVPLFRVWRRPSIDLTLGGPEFSASMASRVRNSRNGRIAVTRGLIEEGAIVAIADAEGSSTGVMLTQSPPAGANAETEFTRQLADGIRNIQRQ